ncbi:MAG TPA: SDR family oxidoreductase [Actinomycetota bacterium]|nr:SDR family oxidoreductase [Actinomycetota bacterium]
MALLDGKVAIVTGAGRGVGRGHALELARHGAKVVVNDLGVAWDGSGEDNTPAGQVVAEIKELGGEAVANYDNVADWQGAQNLINQAVDTFGDLNILINNAGILRDRMLFNMAEEEWDAVVTVHGKGHFAPTRFACAYWRQKGKETGEPVYGRLIHTSSESGLYGNAGQANYDFAKLGICSFSMALAREMAKYGVTSNAIAPRARTRMTEMTFGNIPKPEDGFDPWDPDNIAPFVVFLCTEAAANITGQVFVVTGGEVHLVQQPVVVSSIVKDDRWKVEELGDKVGELFGDRQTGIVDRTPTSSLASGG